MRNEKEKKTSESSPSSFTADIGMEADDKKKVSDILAGILADQHVLYQKTRNYHWNLKSPRFYPLHELFEEQYKALAEAIDETAERMRMIGSVPPGSMGEFLKLAHLKEVPGALVDGEHALASLASDHESCAKSLRKAITEAQDHEDHGTADFLTDLIRAHEKTAWMLRSHLL